MQERIICSAILVNDGVKHKDGPVNLERGFVICGRRHGDCYNTLKYIARAIKSPAGILVQKLENKTGAKDAGFLTSLNRFVDRREGMKIAMAANQLLFPQYHAHKKEDDELFILTSEDLFPYDEYEQQFK